MKIKMKDRSYLSLERFMWMFIEFGMLRLKEKSIDLMMHEVREITVAHAWLAKKKKEGIEKCFHGLINDVEVIVLPTWSDKIGGPKEEDVGWVLNVDTVTKTVLFSFEIRRSPNFIDHMLANAKAHIEIAKKWPLCPLCNIHYGVVQTESGKMHEREFVCLNWHCTAHWQRTGFLVIDIKLTPVNKKVFLEGYIRYEKYEARNQRLGIVHRPRRKMRFAAKYGLEMPTLQQPVDKNIDPPHDESGMYNDGDHLE